MSAPTVLDGLAEVRAAVGRDLGTTAWREIAPEDAVAFEAATGHLDLAWMVLSLTNLFLPELLEVRGVSAGVNYGTETVRFPAPVMVGSRLRARAVLVAAEDVRGGVQTTIRITVELEGSEQPACVLDSLSRWLE